MPKPQNWLSSASFRARPAKMLRKTRNSRPKSASITPCTVLTKMVLTFSCTSSRTKSMREEVQEKVKTIFLHLQSHQVDAGIEVAGEVADEAVVATGGA